MKTVMPVNTMPGLPLIASRCEIGSTPVDPSVANNWLSIGITTCFGSLQATSNHQKGTGYNTGRYQAAANYDYIDELLGAADLRAVSKFGTTGNLPMKQTVLIAAALFAGFGNLHAADELTGDPATGKAHFAVCSGCHGAKAEGNPALQAPKLAGQYEWYIATQLRNFRAGIRGTTDGDAAGAMMAPMAIILVDDQAVQDVAAYIASLP